MKETHHSLSEDASCCTCSDRHDPKVRRLMMELDFGLGANGVNSTMYILQRIVFPRHALVAADDISLLSLWQGSVVLLGG